MFRRAPKCSADVEQDNERILLRVLDIQVAGQQLQHVLVCMCSVANMSGVWWLMSGRRLSRCQITQMNGCLAVYTYHLDGGFVMYVCMYVS